MMRETSGLVSVTGYQLFYRKFEPAEPRGTVLGLHGGPGCTHEYLLPLTDLTRRGYRVVLMDQLGCGRSERPKDYAVSTLEHNVEEVEQLRQSLGLGRVHLLGSSYGGLLALAVAARYPAGFQTLVTTGGLASVPYTVAEMHRLIRELPDGLREPIDRYGPLGMFQHPEYLRAVRGFYRRHLCRLSRWPSHLTNSLVETNHLVYGQMNGPNEFTIIGTIKDIDLTPELGRIRAPTLVTGGRHDEVTPNVARQIHQAISGSEWVVFEESSHVPMWEERAHYIATLARFFDAHPAEGSPVEAASSAADEETRRGRDG